MNVFARVEERVVAALDALKGEGALPADLAIAGIEVRRRAIRRTAISRPTPRWCSPRRRA